MDALPLAVSPVAKLLVGLAERNASGALTLGDRTLVIAGGDLCEVTPAPGDAELGEFMVASARITSADLARAEHDARSQHVSLDDAIVARGLLSKADLRLQRRALWLDRWVRAMRLSEQRQEAIPTLLDASGDAADGGGLRLLPFVLDALARLAFDHDASVVGMHISHRLTWLDGPLREEAERWAAFGQTTVRPVISTILAKVPAVAPQIAALARAGLVRLDAPGTPGARPKSKTGTLPPPPPRLSIIPPAPPAAARVTASSLRPQGPLARPPRMRLDPGADGIPVESIPSVKLTPPQVEPLTLVDPLREIELRIEELEQRSATGPERARAFVELARLWQTRIGSLEEAARALREAAAADPNDTAVLAEAALHCSYLGRVDLGIAYAQTAIAASPISVERAAAYKLLSDIHRAADDGEACIEALSEAAAEDPSHPEPHELLAHLLAERDNLPLAVAHARFAALGWAEHDTRRAAMLYAMAYAWNPSDPLLSEEYAGVLYGMGLAEAAVAVVAETARNLDEADLRRRVRLAAAQRAEAAGRKDLSAELLIEVFDDDPSIELVYAPLDADLNEHGTPAEHAALLESIAAAGPGALRAGWLARAGEVLLRAPEHRDSALRILARAARLDPKHPRVASALAAAGSSLEALSALGPDDDAQLAQLESQLSAAASESEEHALLTRTLDLRAARGDARGVASAALRLLGLDPKHALAAARLWRATTKLGDPALRREALTLRARLAEAERPRGRALAELARHLEQMGDLDAAVASADAALAADPSAADAAIVILRHGHRLEAGRAAHLLAKARTLLGDSPPLLFALAQAALAAGDGRTHATVLREFCDLAPLMVDPRMLALSYSITQNDAAAILENADALLRDAGGPLVVTHAKEAVDKLAELGAHADAARLAQRVLDERGQVDGAYAIRALQLAQASTEPSLIAVALERCASAETGGERLERLLELAAHHRNQRDHVAELRALLRAIALDTTSDRALSELGELFARARDTSRLLTVLGLELDLASEPAERRAKLMEMAACAADGGDLESAVTYLGALMAESADDRDALLLALGALFSLGETRWAIDRARRLAQEAPGDSGGAIYLWIARRAETALDDAAFALELASEGARLFPSVGELLLMVERLTMANRDAQSALGLYRALLDNAIGPHGQRALHYRAGRWLERAGSPNEALPHYLRAFDLARGAGVAYKAIQRVTRATGQLPALIDTMETLAETFRDADARLAMLQEAARLALNELDDAPRGFALLMKADELADIGQLGPALVDAAHRMGSRDRGAEASALGSIASTWEERAQKFWDADTKARLLMHAAQIHLHERSDSSASLRALDAALQTDVIANLSQDVHAATLCAYAEALIESGRSEEAQAVVQRALAVIPDHALAQTLRQKLPRWQDAPAPPPAETPKAREDELRITNEPTPPPPPTAALDLVTTPQPAAAPREEELPPQSTLEMTIEPAIEMKAEPTIEVKVRSAPAPAVAPAPLAPEPPAAPAPDPARAASDDEPELMLEAEDPEPEIIAEPPPAPPAPPAAAAMVPAEPEAAATAALEAVLSAVAGDSAPARRSPPPSAPRPAAASPQPSAAGAAKPAQRASAGARAGAGPHPSAASRPSMGARAEDALRARADAGDTEALSQLAGLASADPSRRAEAHYLLGRLVRAEPFRVEALRQLHRDAVELGSRAEAAVCAEVLSLFNPELIPPRHEDFHAGLLHGESLEKLLDPSTPRDVRKLLALLWENTRGIPRFRRVLESYEVGPRQRVSPSTDAPAALAFAQAARLLSRGQTPVYLKPRAQPALTVVPTHPPAIIARADLAAAPALHYRMAQSLIWADPEHAIVCVLVEQDGRELIEGMLGAFGPKEASRALTRSGKELASSLWHTVPMRSQAQMRDIIHAHLPAIDYDKLRRASILASHRAATFALANARLALETVASLETAPALEPVNTEQGYRHACQQSEAFAEVLRTTLSEGYLALVAQVL